MPLTATNNSIYRLTSVEVVDQNGNPATGRGTPSIIDNKLQFDEGSDFSFLGATDTETVQVRYTMHFGEENPTESFVTLTVNGENDIPLISSSTNVIGNLTEVSEGDYSENSNNLSAVSYTHLRAHET